MTDPATLRALASRIEALTGPDREVDAEVACAMRGYTMHADSKPADGTFAFWFGKPEESECCNCSSWPAFTASLDAAAGLTDGMAWSLSCQRSPDMGGRNWNASVSFSRNYPGKAATPALALLAAALRARAETADG